MKECLKRTLKQKAAQPVALKPAAAQPATKAQPWWAPDAPVAERKPAAPAAPKMNVTVLAELARIAIQLKK